MLRFAAFQIRGYGMLGKCAQYDDGTDTEQNVAEKHFYVHVGLHDSDTSNL